MSAVHCEISLLWCWIGFNFFPQKQLTSRAENVWYMSLCVQFVLCSICGVFNLCCVQLAANRDVPVYAGSNLRKRHQTLEYLFTFTPTVFKIFFFLFLFSLETSQRPFSSLSQWMCSFVSIYFVFWLFHKAATLLLDINLYTEEIEAGSNRVWL